MLRKLVVVWIAVWGFMSLAGCSDNGQEAPSPEQAKAAAEYEAEAEKEITPENVEDELDRLEREIQLEVSE